MVRFSFKGKPALWKSAVDMPGLMAEVADGWSCEGAGWGGGGGGGLGMTRGLGQGGYIKGYLSTSSYSDFYSAMHCTIAK